jgi:hypothetical protein
MVNQRLWWPSIIDFALIFKVEGVSNFTISSSRYILKQYVIVEETSFRLGVFLSFSLISLLDMLHTINESFRS